MPQGAVKYRLEWIQSSVNLCAQLVFAEVEELLIKLSQLSTAV